jgi:hypothetical protein
MSCYAFGRTCPTMQCSTPSPWLLPHRSLKDNYAYMGSEWSHGLCARLLSVSGASMPLITTTTSASTYAPPSANGSWPRRPPHSRSPASAAQASPSPCRLPHPCRLGPHPQLPTCSRPRGTPPLPITPAGRGSTGAGWTVRRRVEISSESGLEGCRKPNR